MERKLLVVDDDPDLTKMIELWVSDLDCQTVVTNDPIEGLQLIETAGCAVLLTDMKMPGTDGLELVRKARTNGMETVAMTAYADVDMLQELLAAHTSDYVAKAGPEVDPETFKAELLGKIGAAFDRQHGRAVVQAQLDPENLGSRIVRGYGDAYYQGTMSLYAKMNDRFEKIRGLCGDNAEVVQLCDEGIHFVGAVKEELNDAFRRQTPHEELEYHKLSDLVAVALSMQSLNGRTIKPIVDGYKGHVVGSYESLVSCMARIMLLVPDHRDFSDPRVRIVTSLRSQRRGGSVALHIKHELVGPLPSTYRLLDEYDQLLGRTGSTIRATRAELKMYGGDMTSERLTDHCVEFSQWFVRQTGSVRPQAAE